MMQFKNRQYTPVREAACGETVSTLRFRWTHVPVRQALAAQLYEAAHESLVWSEDGHLADAPLHVRPRGSTGGIEEVL